MKKYYVIFCFVLLLIPFNIKALDLNISSDNAILYNINEDRVMYEKNSDKKTGIASLTKVMTTLVLLDYIDDFNKEITFDKVDYNYLKKMDLTISEFDHDKKHTYNDFLYDFIMESAADAGYALMYEVSKSEKEFTSLMNNKAKAIGMNNSHFDNIVGNDSKNNYSTASDMLVLMKEALKNDYLKKIMNTMNFTSSSKDKVHHTFYYYIKHFDLDMPYIKGGKTGYNDNPGFCLMSFASKDNIDYILITTNAPYNFYNPNHFNDAKKIYDYFYKNYGYQKIIDKDDIITKVNISYLDTKMDIKMGKDIYYFENNNLNKDDITLKYNGKRSLNILDKKDEKLGYISIYYKDKVIMKENVYLREKKPFSLNKFIKVNYLYLSVATFIYALIIVSTIIIKRKIEVK